MVNAFGTVDLPGRIGGASSVGFGLVVPLPAVMFR